MTVSKTIVPVTAFQQNCSILKCEATGRAAIVDPGGDTGRILAAVKEMGAQVEKILLTHGHMDHCAASEELRGSLPSLQEAEAQRIRALVGRCRTLEAPEARGAVHHGFLLYYFLSVCIRSFRRANRDRHRLRPRMGIRLFAWDLVAPSHGPLQDSRWRFESLLQLPLYCLSRKPWIWNPLVANLGLHRPNRARSETRIATTRDTEVVDQRMDKGRLSASVGCRADVGNLETLVGEGRRRLG